MLQYALGLEELSVLDWEALGNRGRHSFVRGRGCGKLYMMSCIRVIGIRMGGYLEGRWSQPGVEGIEAPEEHK